jgi:hypothetical protein
MVPAHLKFRLSPVASITTTKNSFSRRKAMSDVSVALAEDQLHEIITRCRGRRSVSDVVWNAVQSLLDSTRGDPEIWSEEHATEVAAEEGDDELRRFGSPLKGYHWKNVFLPNGTKIRMKYRGQEHFAEIRQEKMMTGDRETSPSAWANSNARFTARNAWRDLWVLRPGDTTWRLADQLRHQQP